MKLVEGQRRGQTSIATKIQLGRFLLPAKERISSAWSSSTINPAISPLLKRRHASAAISSQRATVFQAMPSIRAIAETLTPSTLRATTRNVGINRIWWDLQNEPSSEIRLRTKPLYAPEVGLGPDRWRPFPGGGRISVLMPPGTYTVRLTAAGRKLTRQLEVRKDPITEGTEADIAAQTDLLFEIRDDLDVVAGMINEIEWIRRQLHDLTDVLEGDDRAADIRAAATDLDKDLMEVEQQLYQLKLTGRGDGIRWPAQLAAKLTYLAGSVAQADFPPTTQALAVHDQLGEQTGTLRSELDEALRDNIAAFNRMLRERDLGKIIADVR